MYHPGRVVEIFSPKSKGVQASDDLVQTMLEMWDENVITVTVDKKLVTILKKDDVVLVDYTSPKLRVIKILKEDLGKNTWKKYRDQFQKRRVDAVSMQKMQSMQQHESYVG